MKAHAPCLCVAQSGAGATRNPCSGGFCEQPNTCYNWAFGAAFYEQTFTHTVNNVCESI